MILSVGLVVQGRLPVSYRRGRKARVLRQEELPVQYVPALDLIAGPTAADLMIGVTEGC